jgi:hypothetical protein
MKRMRLVLVGLLVAFATVLLVKCSVERANAPEIPPESSFIVGAEPKVPKVFFGCWEGNLREFDTAKSYTFLSDEQIRTAAADTTYQLCFSPRPDGTGLLELTKAQVGGNEIVVTRFDNRITGGDPEHYRAHMQNHVVADSKVMLLWIFPVHVTQEIYAEEDLELKSPDLIFIRGRQLVVMSGKVIAEMTFHADFRRVPRAVAQVARARKRG